MVCAILGAGGGKSVARYLVPMDGSADSASGLAVALSLARPAGASVVALFVSPPTGFLRRKRLPAKPLEEFSEWQQDEGDEAQLALLPAKVWGKTAGVKTEALVARGDVAEEILATATALKVELIVMGSHGKSGGSGGRLLGSVAREVFTKSPVPTVVVPPNAVEDPEALARDVARFSQGLPIGPKIVAAIDGGPGSETVLDEALRLAQSTHGSLRLLAGSPRPANASPEPLFAKVEAAAHAAGVPLQRDAKEGDALTRLVDLSLSHEAELVVVGTRAKAGATPDHLGSFTDRLLAKVACPVEVLRLTVRR
jgi:nucleotide-binding universal stress UspA family protein